MSRKWVRRKTKKRGPQLKVDKYKALHLLHSVQVRHLPPPKPRLFPIPPAWKLLTRPARNCEEPKASSRNGLCSKRHHHLLIDRSARRSAWCSPRCDVDLTGAGKTPGHRRKPPGATAKKNRCCGKCDARTLTPQFAACSGGCLPFFLKPPPRP